MATITCPVCGKEQQIPEGRTTAFCMYCGTKLTVPAAAPAPAPEPAPEPAPAPAPEPAPAPAPEPAPAPAPAAEPAPAAAAAATAPAPEAPKKKSAKGLIIGLIAAVLVLGGAAAAYFTVIKPNSDYKNAKQLMEEGQYGEAIDAFEAMGDYKDAKKLVDECYLNKAVTELQGGKTTKALKSISSIEDETLDLAPFKEAANALVVEILKDGDLNDAKDTAESLKEYVDEADEGVKAYLQKQLDGGKFSSAAEFVKTFTPYVKDKNLVKNTVKSAFENLLKDNKIYEAETLLDSFPDDIGDVSGVLLERFKNDVTAGGESDLNDASFILAMFDKYTGELAPYEAAVKEKMDSLLADGNDDGVTSLYYNFDSYLDIETMMKDSVTGAMQTALENKDWARVDSLADDFHYYVDNVTEPLTTLLADMVSEGNYEEALEALNQFSSYYIPVDETKYAIGEKLLADKDYDGAIAVFEDLGYYSDSNTKVKEIKYQKAMDLYEAKDYDAAIEIFEDLSYYSDSSDKVKEVKYQKATDLMAEEKYEEAAEVFRGLSYYSDSNDQYKEARLLLARQKAAAETLTPEEFVEIYNILNDIRTYSDAQDDLVNLLVRWVKTAASAETTEERAVYIEPLSELYIYSGVRTEAYPAVLEVFPDLVTVGDDGVAQFADEDLMMDVQLLAEAMDDYSTVSRSYKRYVAFLIDDDANSLSTSDLKNLFEYRPDVREYCISNGILLYFLEGTWTDDEGTVKLRVQRSNGQFKIEYYMPTPSGSYYRADSRGFTVLDADRNPIQSICTYEIIDWNTLLVHSKIDGTTYKLTR